VLWWLADRFPRAEVQREFRKLEQEALKQFRDEHWRGALHYERSLDLRYRGQGYELNIPAGTDISERFHAEHQRRYGYHHAGREIELVTLRLRARMTAPRLNIGRTTPKTAGRVRPVSPVERCSVIFQSRALATPVYERSQVRQGQFLRGPAVITEYSATTVIPPGKKFWVDKADNLVIALGGKGGRRSL